MIVKELIEELKQYKEDWIVGLGIECLQVHPSNSFYPEYIIDIGYSFIQEVDKDK